MKQKEKLFRKLTTQKHIFILGKWYFCKNASLVGYLWIDAISEK